MENMILNVDSYKLSHSEQYPKGIEEVWSYVESRGGEWDELVFFGLQMFLKRLAVPITLEMISEAEEMATAHGVPFNTKGFMSMLYKYNGHWPVEIEAVKEGTVLPTKNVLVQIHNTDPEFYWVTSYLETALLRAIWYPTSTCTNSWQCKQKIRKALEETSDDAEAEINFKLHDFGGRGATCEEAAGIGGAGHLVNFLGTDTMSALVYARRYYGESMAGFSIPAAEHSTITSWGGPEEEIKAFENMITKFSKPGSIYAVVSDSYNIWNAVKMWGTALKDKVISSGGTLVVRPDSGDPLVVPVEVIKELMKYFGHTVNTKGYKVLPSYVRVIQGDGVNINSIEQILKNMKEQGLSASNIAFGMGGALLQGVNRDTLKFAMKACAVKVNGMYRDVFKDPITDKGKISKKGRLALIKENGEWQTIRLDALRTKNYLEPVFRNGHILRTQSFKEIRELANKGKNS